MIDRLKIVKLNKLLIFKIGLISFLLFNSNCAFMNKQNRVITNALDEKINPESTSSKILLSPVAIPLGTFSLLADTFILHPISVIPNAIKDAYEILWENPEGGVVRQTFLLIPKLIFTPIVLISSWIGRSIFDV